MVTNLTAAILVCVYYRVAEGESARVISTVREFQRTLRPGDGTFEPEVLLRCDLPFAAPAPDDLATPVSPPASPPPGADATVMETYRFPLPANPTDATAAAVVRDFLEALDAAAIPLAGLLRGPRHVELFSPCAL
jgi:hypothetical protein